MVKAHSMHQIQQDLCCNGEGALHAPDPTSRDWADLLKRSAGGHMARPYFYTLETFFLYIFKITKYIYVI